MTGARELSSHYLYLEPGGDAFTFEPDAGFWPALIRGDAGHAAAARVRVGGGWLMSAFTASGTPGHWEAHPNGEEVLHCAEGSVDLQLEEADGTRVVALAAGEFFVMPRGVFHRIVATPHARMLVITHGEGTQMKP